MNETNSLESVTDWLSECGQPLIISHTRPDGDALGSMAGMALGLRQLGREPVLAVYEPLPQRYEYFPDMGLLFQNWENDREVLEDICDSVVIVDTCAISQLEPIAEYLARAPRTLVIDHHATRDPIGTRPGDLRFFDETASATALIVAEWLQSAGLHVDKNVATATFTGIATDTGWFRYSNTDERTLRVSADLVARGADPGGLFQSLNQQEPLEKLKLVAQLLGRLELHADGRLAVMTLRESDFAESGADRSMTDDLINEATRLRGTVVTLLFTEEAEGTVRVNFRSKYDIDVSDLARRYGGGGHARAAGARVRGRWEDVVPRMIAETAELL